MLNNQIQEIVKNLTEEFHASSGLVRIYAYGSRVRGDEEVGSDLDLLVELKQVTPEIKRQIQDRAWELSLASGFVISVLIVSEELFERGPLSVSEFAENIRRYGVEVLAS